MKQIVMAGCICLLAIPGYSQDQNFPAKVGISIGSATPQAKLHIGAASVDSNASTIRIGVAADQGNRYVPLNGLSGAYNIDFHTWRDMTPDQIGARIRAERINRYQENNGLVQGMDLTFHTSSALLATDLTERMRIHHLGNVGIGTATPAARLHVNGAPNSTLVAQYTRAGVSAADARLYFYSTSSDLAQFVPAIRGRSYIPGKPHGMVIVGEAEDIAATGADNGVAAIVIDGRSKSDTRLTANNVLAVNSASTNLMMVKGDGTVGIGTADTKGYKLAVNGSAIFTKVTVKAFAAWPDYVFDERYQLRTIPELERFVTDNRHLPGMPTAAETTANGQDLGEMNRKLLEKVEELTLYIIQLNKRLDDQQQEIKKLKKG